MSIRPIRSLTIAACLAASGSGHAASAVASVQRGLEACAAIAEDADRLRCFDTLSSVARDKASMDVVAISPDSAAATPASLPHQPVTAMSSRWELEPASKHGTWSFRAHKPNFALFGRYTDDVNMEPYEALFEAGGDPDLGLDSVEAKFQLSFKIKALEGLFGSDADLWVAYTQQNHWQVYNDDISSPFRETNYEPEVFVTFPTRYDFLGLTGRFVNLGFVHQSNGRSDILSRSWNRVYAQFGFEAGDRFNLLFKPWYRIEEDADEDDNPDITDYLGDFELVGTYRLGNHSLTALGRTGFDFERGFLQLSWAFPVYQNLRGYVQASTGYGESMIDYNHYQNTIGIGVLLTDWM
jgi:phospholipase A1/A2